MRPVRHEDALPELFLGLAALIAALFFFALAAFGPLAVLAGFVQATSGHVLLAGFTRARRRRRDQTPLTFRQWLRDMPRGWNVAFVGGGIGFLVLSLLRLAGLTFGVEGPDPGSLPVRWLLLLVIVPIVGAFGNWWWRSRSPRHLGIGAIAVAAATAGPLLGFAWEDSLALTAGVTGLALLSGGVLLLSELLRSHSGRAASVNVSPSQR